MTKKGNISRLSAALAMSFRSKNFTAARIKLTVFYELAVVLILAFFNIGVYGLLDKTAGNMLGFDKFGIQSLKEIVQKTEMSDKMIAKEKEKMKTILLFLDGIILVAAGGASYFLAGYTLRPIEESYERQKKFLADAAHELRTPITVMKTGIQDAIEGEVDRGEYKQLAEDSLEELDFLNTTVNDLLFLARGDNIKKVAFGKVCFKRLIEKQTSLMQPYAQQKNVSLEISDLDNLELTGDEAQLKRLLANLIKNAVDYNVANGKVIISCKIEKRFAHLIIKDTGIGIPDEDQERIFDRFYKVDSSRQRKLSGAGLGLSIVSEIVEFHRGYIDMKSKLEEGTEISVFLPLNA